MVIIMIRQKIYADSEMVLVTGIVLIKELDFNAK
jgi:hypothetical protein